MGFLKQIRAAHKAGQLVRVEREAVEFGWMTGYVTALGTEYFAFEIVTGSVRLDGVACLRYADVTACGAEPRSGFIERALKARGLVRASQLPVDLASLPRIIESCGNAFPIITLHVPHSDGQGYDCFIGKVIGVNDDSVDFHHITPDGAWEDVLLEIPFDEITRVDFGGDYEEALLLAAGRPPAI